MRSEFSDALLGASCPVIMEVKRQDADGNDLLGGRSLACVVRSYEAAGAPCISVVTGKWFGGSTAMLSEVAELTGLPLLQKDFVTKRRQVAEARQLGASAVLLTAALLPKAVLGALVEFSASLGMTPFIEVASEAEIASVAQADECVVAVNNKEIKAGERGEPTVARSLSLLPSLRASGTRCPVSASGISSPKVAAGLLDAGFAGLLIGSGLLRAERVTDWTDELDHWRRVGAERA